MSDKLNHVQAHIAGVEGLESVVGAMRGIAAARSREARQRVAGIRACAGIVRTAIGDALLLEQDEQDEEAHTPPLAPAVRAELHIVFCAGQGFVGAFNEHLIDAARAGIYPARGDACFLVGERGLTTAQRHGLKVIWSTPMASHAGEASALADRITQALYDQIGAGRFSRVKIIHAIPSASAHIAIADELLLPLDLKCFRGSKRRFRPLVTLPVPRLLQKLAVEYIYTQLFEASMLSFAAENDARMHAMVAERANVRATLERLMCEFRRLRQEEITAEIVELSAGCLNNR